MPRAPRTSSASLNAAPELAHIAGIAVAGVAAYGRQVCEICGQGWPWTVFQKQPDGNRDLGQTACLRCTDPRAEQVRWSMHRNEMKLYIQAAKKQRAKDGPEAPVPSILLGKEKDWGLHVLKSTASRASLPQQDPINALAGTTSSPATSQPPASSAADPATQPARITAPLNQKLHADAIHAARLANARAAQDAIDRQSARLAQSAARARAVEEERQRQARAHEQAAQMAAALEYQRQQLKDGQRRQAALQRQTTAEDHEYRIRSEQHRATAKAAIRNNLGQLYGAETVASMDMAQHAVMQLQGQSQGLMWLGLSHEEFGFMRLAEPMRAEVWLQLNYEPAPPSNTTVIRQVDVYRHYQTDFNALNERMNPQAKAALGIVPITIGRNLVQRVQVVYPNVQLVSNDEIDAAGQPTGKKVYSFRGLVARNQQQGQGRGGLIGLRERETVLMQGQMGHAGQGPAQSSGVQAQQGQTAGYTSQAHARGATQSQPQQAQVNAQANVDAYVRSLPSFAPARSHAQFAQARAIGQGWIRSGRPYVPHGPGTFGQRLPGNGPAGYVCVYDDERTTIWEGPGGSSESRMVDRSGAGRMPQAAAQHRAYQTAVEAQAQPQMQDPSGSRQFGSASDRPAEPAALPPVRLNASPSGNMLVVSDSAAPGAVTVSAADARAASSPAIRTVTAPRFSTSSVSSLSGAIPAASVSSSAVVKSSSPLVPVFSTTPTLDPTAPALPVATAGAAAATMPRQARASLAAAVQPPVFSTGGSRFALGLQGTSALTSQTAGPSVSYAPLLASATSDTAAQPPAQPTIADPGPTITGKGIQIIELDTSRFKRKRGDADPGMTSLLPADPFDLSDPAQQRTDVGAEGEANADAGPSNVAAVTILPESASEQDSDWTILDRQRGKQIGAGAGEGESTIVTPSVEVLQRAGLRIGEEGVDDEDLADMDMVVDLISEDVTRE